MLIGELILINQISWVCLVGDLAYFPVLGPLSQMASTLDRYCIQAQIHCKNPLDTEVFKLVKQVWIQWCKIPAVIQLSIQAHGQEFTGTCWKDGLFLGMFLG